MMLLVMVAMTADASASEFNPDRPGFSDSTGTVPPGRLMTEAGGLLAAQSGSMTLGAPGLLIRGGLTRNLELRVAAPDLAVPLSGGDIAVGATGLGLKAAVGMGDVGLSVVGTVPVTAASSLDAGVGAPSLGVNAAGPAGETLGWGANAVVTAGEVPGWAGSLALGRGLGDSAGAYLQGAAIGGGGSFSPLVGVGGNLMLMPETQLDLFVDVLPVDGPAVNVGLGIAHQW